jgi:hypothetical protein
VNALVVNVARTLGNQAQRLGPYLLIELLLPGGTLFALLLFLYRQQMNKPRRPNVVREPVVATSTLAGARPIAMLPHGVYAIAGAGAVACAC